LIYDEVDAKFKNKLRIKINYLGSGQRGEC
jgi:hypothetical protein